MTDADGFQLKQLRCEWQVISVFVNPDGRRREVNQVLARFPSHDLAVAALPKWGRKHEHLTNVWLPLSSTNEYERIAVTYAEVNMEI